MQRFLFRPFDTLFFRDGRPFEQADEGMAEVASLFPPHPGVLGGALRAALARAQGWNGSGDWRDQRASHDGRETTLGDVIGDGADPGLLALGPPAVLQRHDDGWRRLYPAPQHLLAGGDPQCPCLAFVEPTPVDDRALHSDLADVPVRLPEMRPKVEGAKPLAGKWLTPAGLATVLDGRRPDADDIIGQDELWQQEFRVGLQRGGNTRAAVPGMLYAASFARLKNAAALGIEVKGLDPNWVPQSPAVLGGSQRLTQIEAGEWEEASHNAAASGELRFVIVLTGPMKPEGPGWRTPGAEFDPQRLPGARVVAACVDRPVMIGGWDSIAHQPRPLQPYLPAGSVFFLEGAAPADGWPPALGGDTKQGYGRYLAGRWPNGGNS